MVCPCCCIECPSVCEYGLSATFTDRIGELSAMIDGCLLDPCATNPVSDSDELIVDSERSGFSDQINLDVNYSSFPSGLSFSGRANAEHKLLAGDAQYFRSGGFQGSIFCGGIGLPKWSLDLALDTFVTVNTPPFVSGIGFQKEQRTTITLGVEIELPECARFLDLLEVLLTGSGVTIGETTYDWDVVSYDESCQLLDEENVYQPCEDYLEPTWPEMTVTLSRLPGC